VSDGALEGRRIEIRGVVQGVGMRPSVHRVAVACGVAGRVWNHPRGVTIEAFGPAASLERFVARLRAEAPPAARYDEVREAAIPFERLDGFHIVASEPLAAGAERRISIPPDLATCADCLRELADPADRRYRYPFTNCTNCGPRFTIARGVPYDRPLTTMAAFQLCAACRREYEDPADRRFHAEPNACPACGPRLTLLAPDGAALATGDDALVEAARALAAGRIVAVKGIGGFHLACDATSSPAVAALRERKRRDAKPLAVMVPGLADAERLARLGDAERALLRSVERPIVLAPRREEADVAPEVAPDTQLLGLFLPYSPLHHLLLAGAGRPLVMTSANLSDEPIAYRNAEALERLGGIADLLLVHDREIETRADDSVARVVAGRPLVMRRSRGFAPRGIPLARPLARPLLAAGAHLKNTFCLALGDAAHLGPHIGDLENLETLDSYEASIARMERFLETRPEAIAHDLHPEYLSTRWARERAARDRIPLVGVQHHHAHVASCMGEHGLEGPVLGLAWDGVGLGDDGTPWGSELLLATYAGHERLATFRPIALAGGDRAVKETWRVALAALDDAFGGALPDAELRALALFRELPAAEVEIVRRMIATGTNAPRAHGCGRWFDAFSALALARPRARYEGQLAMALEGVAAGEAPAYPFEVEVAATPWQLDLRPALRGAVEDLLAGRAAGLVSTRFHETLVEGAAALVELAAVRHGRLPVVLTGGCFQNARLGERLRRRLGGGFEVYLHGSVPPGDGGIALGQVLVADARLRRG
jgi:hydrogenase maturation protein HypF